MLQVLFADGSVSSSHDSGPVWVLDSEVEEEKNLQEAEDKKKSNSASTQNAKPCLLRLLTNTMHPRLVGQ